MYISVLLNASAYISVYARKYYSARVKLVGKRTNVNIAAADIRSTKLSVLQNFDKVNYYSRAVSQYYILFEIFKAAVTS